MITCFVRIYIMRILNGLEQTRFTKNGMLSEAFATTGSKSHCITGAGAEVLLHLRPVSF